MADPFDVDLDTARRRHSLKWRRYPRDVIPLWIAEMDFALAPAIGERLHAMVDRHDVGYPPEDDESDVRRAIASWMERRHGWEVDHELVTLVPDTMRALEIAVQVFSEPGSPVVLTDPVYFPFRMAIEDADRVPLWVPMVRSGLRWEHDMEAMAAAFSRDDVRLFLLCHPHNPTGSVFTSGELSAIADLAAEHGVVVASDEIHADLSYGRGTHVPFATIASDRAVPLITASSASKAFNLPGLKCAFFIAGDRPVHATMRTTPIRWRQAVGIAGVEATIAAFGDDGEQWLGGLVAHLEQMRDHAIIRLRAIDDTLVAAVPEATYLLWTDWRRIDLPSPPEEFLLRRAKVALNDGAAFGPSAGGFMRLNFGTSRSILDTALDRIETALAR